MVLGKLDFYMSENEIRPIIYNAAQKAVKWMELETLKSLEEITGGRTLQNIVTGKSVLKQGSIHSGIKASGWQTNLKNKQTNKG